ncbi:ABC transporter permease [Oricola indica]|jgi:putative ABC transport system permease protein|uniref:ABC transporter permease n=1 Tax=Oricola indica TaxID=2872591 RepID=UPI001CC0A25C|nr:ABC transporter permease [Oricola indica]
MRALDKKLLRDFRRLWAQGLSIALVLACGVAIVLISYGMYGALENTRSAYYERNRFADVFASATRAPRNLKDEIAGIEGVWAVELRTVKDAVLDLPNRVKTATGRIISLPANGAILNVPLVRSGRPPDPDASDEIMVNEPFALENDYQLGDIIQANLNGRKRPLTIVGTALSPEYIYTIGPGSLMPDNENFGILWMAENAAASAFDMSGAFNDVSLKLTRSADADEVVDRLDDILRPYGGTGAYGRDQQMSDAFIDSELLGLETMARILPPVFFGIAAFLVNMVIGRIVALERSQIGLMKALGYTNFTIAMHYIMLSALIAVIGVLIGWGLGTWAARGMALMYAEFFTFPYLIFSVSKFTYVLSGVLGLLSAALGAVFNAMKAARLAPAVAMSPPAPPNFRRGLFDRLFASMRLSQPTMMILRGIMRWPLRASLTSLGMALGVAVLVASSFFDDSMEEILDVAFFQSNRQDAILLLSGDQPLSVLEDIERLPGILRAEGQYSLPVRLTNGHLEKRVSIEASWPNADLSRVIDPDGKVIEAPAEGILLTKRLAGQLDVRPGEWIDVEFLTGRREEHHLVVSGIVTQYFGMGAYMDAEYAARLFRQSPRISAANVLVDENRIDELHQELKDTPNLAGLIMLTDTRQTFRDTIKENIVIQSVIYIAIAAMITIGVTYNSARIQLSERARELASLRILGFTNAEVSYILMGETLLLAIVAQPLGWAVGALLAWGMSFAFASDLYTIPVVLKNHTFGFASVVALVAAVGSVLVVRRRLDTLDLVSVMKTRE